MRRLPFCSIAVLVFGSACDKSGASDAVTIRDSAGIQIVENRLRTDGDSGIVRVAGRSPDLSIGVVEGDSVYQFFTVWGARRLSDGGIAVLNQSTYEVRYYDAAGKFVRAVGRHGQGPGEFDGPYGPLMICSLRGDSLAAMDGAGSIASVFDRNGKYVRRIAMPPGPTGRRLLARGCTLDGDILAGPAIIRVEPRPGTWSDSLWLVWVRADGTLGESIGQFRHNERYQVLRPTGPGVASLVFGRTLQVAVGDDDAFIGDSEAYEISVYGRDGKVKRIIRHGIPARQVTDSMKRAHEEAAVRDAAARAAARGAPPTAPDEARYAATVPPYSKFLTGRDGGLWVLRNERLAVKDSIRANRWDVFGSDGGWRAAVDLPADLDLLDAAPDYALGAWRNTDGVEFVHLYRIALPPTR